MLIDHYTPADYRDSFVKGFWAEVPMTPDYLFERMFCTFPKPVEWLMKLRNAIVKPFGLEGGKGFQNLIIERNQKEIVLGKSDRHLDFYVGLYCSAVEEGVQDVSVTTVVRFNNFLGRLYFAAIWIFHKLIVSTMFRRSVKAFIRAMETGH